MSGRRRAAKGGSGSSGAELAISGRCEARHGHHLEGQGALAAAWLHTEIEPIDQLESLSLDAL